MKHVHEALPDVQMARPEISAALAAVVDRATAKRQQDRYADDAELIADLEDVLTIEAARAGSATGEVTSVLRTLPSTTQRRVPYRIRHRIVAGLLTLLGIAAVGGGIAWLVTRAHRGTGVPPPITQPHHRSLHAVGLCQNCAQGFNPLGSPSDEAPNAGLAIDDQPNTYWRTQQYYDHKLEKLGTGIYLDASPGGGTSARAVRITDATPGFPVTIYARESQPPLRWPDPGWVRISAPTTVQSNTLIHVNTGGRRYNYFLVWITGLGGHEQLAIAQVTLYR
jgi:serine/threonine-protein kinase